MYPGHSIHSEWDSYYQNQANDISRKRFPFPLEETRNYERETGHKRWDMGDHFWGCNIFNGFSHDHRHPSMRKEEGGLQS